MGDIAHSFLCVGGGGTIGVKQKGGDMGVALKLNDVLHLTDEQVGNSKIELNMRSGGNGERFIDLWLSLEESKRASGMIDFPYWGWYGNKQRNFHEGQWVFSFIRLNAGNEWLFVSAAKILSVPEQSHAEIEILEQYEPLFGRMIVHLEKGQTYSRYVFNLSKYLDSATIKEVLPTLYSGDTFQGYDCVHLPYAKLDRIFSRQILPTYYDALEHATGVYCLTDTRTGKLYIGSATGEGGVAQRWGNYLDSKHGGNVKLRELYDREGEEYFKKYFEFTLLEYYGMSYDPQRILDRESYWKDCLDTRRHGYNDN